MNGKRKKVFVTGATGFIGSNLVRKLLREKFEVHIIHRKSSDLWRINDIMGSLELHTGDITDEESIKKIVNKIKPAIIIHLANIGVYGGHEGEEKEVIDVNINGLLNLLKATRKIKYECFINTGSSSEYGSKNKPMSEDDSCFPESTYAVSKLAATLLAKNEFNEIKKPIVTLRLFSPYGPYDNESRLIPYLLIGKIKGKDLLLGNTKSVRDYVFIDDVCEAYIQAIKKIEKIKGEILNIGSGQQHTVKDIVKEVNVIDAKKTRIVWGSKIAKRFESKVWQSDQRKTRRLLGWSAKTSLDEGLAATYNWHRKRLNS